MPLAMRQQALRVGLLELPCVEGKGDKRVELGRLRGLEPLLGLKDKGPGTGRPGRSRLLAGMAAVAEYGVAVTTLVNATILPVGFSERGRLVRKAVPEQRVAADISKGSITGRRDYSAVRTEMRGTLGVLVRWAGVQGWGLWEPGW